MFTIVTIQRLGPDSTREEADRLAAFTVAGEPPDEITARVVEGEPVVLSGLVKGGEYASAEDWCDNIGPLEVLATAADGRVVSDYDDARSAEARGALPVTWYRYEEP